MSAGRPPLCPEETLRRIVAERLRRRTFDAIAEGLNADGVLTGTGKRWQRASVFQTFYSMRGRQLVEAWQAVGDWPALMPQRYVLGNVSAPQDEEGCLQALAETASGSGVAAG